jgi:hypothetical protein
VQLVLHFKRAELVHHRAYPVALLSTEQVDQVEVAKVVGQLLLLQGLQVHEPVWVVMAVQVLTLEP